MAYTSYTVKQGDRWDSISYAAYGDVKYMNSIIEANFNVPLDIPLTPGIVLQIPVIDIVETQTELLPPWKQ